MTLEPTPQRSGFDFYLKSPKGVEVAFHVSSEDVEIAKEGTLIGSLVRAFKEADELLQKAGFTRSDRLDRPANNYGGGKGNWQQKPKTPWPDEYEIPKCCGVDMVYFPHREAQGDRKALNEHGECAEGQKCAFPRVVGDKKYPRSQFELTKKAGTPPASTAGKPSAPAQEPAGDAKVDVSAWWATARKHAEPAVVNALLEELDLPLVTAMSVAQAEQALAVLAERHPAKEPTPAGVRQ